MAHPKKSVGLVRWQKPLFTKRLYKSPQQKTVLKTDAVNSPAILNRGKHPLLLKFTDDMRDIGSMFARKETFQVVRFYELQFDGFFEYQKLVVRYELPFGIKTKCGK